MQLRVSEEQPTLFKTDEDLEGEVVESAGRGSAILVVKRKTGPRQYLTPGEAAKEGVVAEKVTAREAAMLRGAGYQLAEIPAD